MCLINDCDAKYELVGARQTIKTLEDSIKGFQDAHRTIFNKCLALTEEITKLKSELEYWKNLSEQYMPSDKYNESRIHVLETTITKMNEKNR